MNKSIFSKFLYFFVSLSVFTALVFILTSANVLPSLKTVQNELNSLIILEGTYQGKNLRVKNPYVLPNEKYCTTEILINDVPSDKIYANDIEVDLSNFEKGEYVNIQIKHNDGCEPEVVNPEVLRSKSTFEIVTITADLNLLKWTTKNETNQEPYIIEQKQYNKWVPIGKVIAKGTPGYNSYTFAVQNFSGLNEYRLKQSDLLKAHYRYSEPAKFNADIPPVTFYPERVLNCIYLSRKTKYQIFTESGILVKQGEDYQIKLPNLNPGPYYLYIDNRVERILKK
jgi:hypothetical protein